MKKIYYFLLAMAPPIAVLAGAPIEAGLASVIFGFSFASIYGVYVTFRKHKHGIFSQWTDPGKFMEMKFDERELRFFWVGIVLAFGGLVAILLQTLR